MRQKKKDLIIQLEIYILFGLPRQSCKQFVLFERTYPWQSHHTGVGPVKAACIIPNKPEFFEALFSPQLHL